MPLKSLLCFLLFSFATFQLFAQANGDPGIGTIGNFDETYHDSLSKKKNEADILFTYGTNGSINYFQPQINLRRFYQNNSFIELRLPYSIANGNNISTSGMGDAIATYNAAIPIKKKSLKISVGTRISFSNAFLGNSAVTYSYPMAYQPGLGTVDLMAAADYDLNKYLSVAAGVQVPLFTYNKNIAEGTNQDGSLNNQFVFTEYHRVPDAMLKLTGHFGASKFKVNIGVTSIFHLSDDYYASNSGATEINGNYYMENSYGAYLNANATLNYIINKQAIIGLFFSQSIISPENNAAGLARNFIISPKLTYNF